MPDEFLQLINGVPTRVELNDTSVGVADAGKGVALNVQGLIDQSMGGTGIVSYSDGDILYGLSGSLTKLPVDTNDKILTLVAGLPSWETPAIGITDHGDLTGLLDDDHTQYLLADGSRSITGQLTSTVIPGTSPFVIASTTLVTNLNADLLDGNHASAFAPVSHTHDASDIVSGVFVDARISQSSVTQHETALTITESQISDLQNYSLVGHTHDASDILSGVLLTVRGGTGFGLYTIGDLLYADTTTTLTKLVIGTNTQVLTLTAGVPTWSTPDTVVTDHGALTGLGDDDHTQYFLADGSRNLTGQLTSTVITGTSPFIIASTTLVSNLNADLLDGNHASAFALVSHTHDTSDVVSGSFDDARIAQSNVTQHEAALSITESQISDLQNYSLVGHTHAASDIISGVLLAVRGGTGFGGYSVGDLLYADTTTTLIKLIVGTNAQVLTLAAGVPTWTTPDTVITSHGGLTDLLVDDHTQYFLADGTRDLTGQLTSTVTTGTSPFIIASTTLVTNLNADLLDGQHASAFSLSSHTHDASDIVSGLLLAVRGGTGFGSYSVGDLLYADTTTTLTKLVVGTNTQVLTLAAAVPTWADSASGVTDHGALTGLGDDDHSQYALLAGRVGNQTLIGGTAASGTLRLDSTSNATKGRILLDSTTSYYDSVLEKLVLKEIAEIGLGGTSFTSGTLQVGATTSPSPSQKGIVATSTLPNGITNTWRSFDSQIRVDNGTSLTNLTHYRVTDITLIGTGTVANHVGLRIDQLTGGTANNWSILTQDTPSLFQGVINSNVITGTAPFVVASTTLVTNLNADLLDGQHASAFSLTSHTHVHSTLTSLLVDDHTQYALLAGRAGGQVLIGGTGGTDTIVLQGNTSGSTGSIDVANTAIILKLTGIAIATFDDLTPGKPFLTVGVGTPITGLIQTGQFISQVTAGTEPYACTSTTVNTNFNADLLDGNHASAFAQLVHTHSATDIVTGVLAETQGGTGTGNYAIGDILFADSISTLGKLVVGTNGQVLTLVVGVPSWVAPDHGTLDGLGDDDHTQYLLANGIRDLTGQLTSTVTIGTAPFVIASTTLNVNLNADLLDGNEASAFALDSHNHDASDITTGTLLAVRGGTGFGVYAVGDLIYADTTTTFTKLVVGTNNQVLTLAAGVPTWATPDIVITDHGALTGLGDDDHTQYLLANGSRDLTGQLTSTVTTGTAPFVIASTTLVTNLNADLLDGNQASVFGLVSGTLAQFAATTSLQLAGVISDETGTGLLVFATDPVLTTPNIGTPSAGVLTNCTGLPLTTGITGTLALANGGTGVTSLAANAIPKSTGTTLIASLITDTGTKVTVGSGQTPSRIFNIQSDATQFRISRSAVAQHIDMALNAAGNFSMVQSGINFGIGTFAPLFSFHLEAGTRTGSIVSFFGNSGDVAAGVLMQFNNGTLGASGFGVTANGDTFFSIQKSGKEMHFTEINTVRGRFAGTMFAAGPHAPTAQVDASASTASQASLRLRSGVAPTSPNSGDMWYDGSALLFRDGAVTRTITWT